MLQQILCCTKILCYTIVNFILRQISCCIKFYSTSNFMLHQFSCCIKFYSTSNFMLHQISCCIKFYAYVKFHAKSNFMIPTSIVRCGLVARQENEATRFPPKRLLWLFVNMAESEEDGSPVKFSTAISLLRQATNILSGLSNSTNTSTTSATTSSTPKVYIMMTMPY